MGPVLFQSFFLLTSGYGCFEIVVLKTTAWISFRRCFFHQQTTMAVCDINPGIERFVMLEHAVNDPHYFMHQNAHGCHVVLSAFLMFIVDLLDQRIALKRRQSGHV